MSRIPINRAWPARMSKQSTEPLSAVSGWTDPSLSTRQRYEVLSKVKRE